MNKSKELRARGAKPQDPDARRQRVQTAVRDLEKIGAAFSVADVAERAGVSRATIYRSQDLRELIGAKGNGPRTVDAALHEKICARHDTQKAKVRALRRELAELEQSWDEMRERAKTAEMKLAAAVSAVCILNPPINKALPRLESSAASPMSLTMLIYGLM